MALHPTWVSSRQHLDHMSQATVSHGATGLSSGIASGMGLWLSSSFWLYLIQAGSVPQWLRKNAEEWKSKAANGLSLLLISWVAETGGKQGIP